MALAKDQIAITFTGVKFLMATLVYVIAALILGLGILLTVKGNPWLLIAGAATYVVMLGAIGCREPQSH